MEYNARRFHEEARSIQSDIDAVRARQNSKELIDLLEPRNLTRDAIILRQRNKAQVIPHEALLGLEMFGEMSLHVKKGEVYELQTFGVGRSLSSDVSFVSKFVMPKPERIIVLSEGGNIITGSGERISTFDKLVEEEGEYGNRTMSTLLKDMINKKELKDVEILKSFRNDFGSIFARGISIEEILDADRKWEMISSPYSVAYTDNYWGRVREAGQPLLDVHTHGGRAGAPPSTIDAWACAGPDKNVRWAGILDVAKRPVFGAGPTPEIVGYAAPSSFEFSPEKFSAFYSEMEDVEWLRKAVSELSDNSLRKKLVRGAEKLLDRNPKILRDFQNTHAARVMTYGELLEEAG